MTEHRLESCSMPFTSPSSKDVQSTCLVEQTCFGENQSVMVSKLKEKDLAQIIQSSVVKEKRFSSEELFISLSVFIQIQ